MSARLRRQKETRFTPKQAAFCREFLIDLNASAAARRAGYAPGSASVTGCQLLVIPKIATHIAELQDERAERLEVDADWVLERLVEIVRRTMQEVRPALDRSGRPIQDDQGHTLNRFDAQAANRALELIGRHVDIQAWRDRLEVKGEVSLIDRIHAARRRVAPAVDADYSEVDPASARAFRLQPGRGALSAPDGSRTS